MHRPSATALSARARVLLEQMQSAERWVYAVPMEEVARHLRGRTSRLSIAPREDLDVTLVEARGEDAAAELAELLAHTGFFAQSTLLDSAFDVCTADAGTALLTLAHMAVCWDDTWADLFALHLAADSTEVRCNALTALVVAAQSSGAGGAISALLNRAREREVVAPVLTAIDGALAVLGTVLREDTEK